MLIALGRFPHALATCASSIESSMKSFLETSPKDKPSATWLYSQSRKAKSGLESFESSDLELFRMRRNDFVHYGFGHHDDEEAAALLLKTGLPFMKACQSEFFGFDLVDGLVGGFGEHLDIALKTYQKARHVPNLHFAPCFGALAHLIRWSLKESLVSDWEARALVRAESHGAAFEKTEEQKDELERIFGVAWPFDCPVCGGVDVFVCELDESSLVNERVTPKRAACANCNLLVVEMPLLVEALVETQIEAKRVEILREHGVCSTQD